MISDPGILLTYLAESPPKESFDAFLDALARDIDSVEKPRAVIYEVPRMATFDATLRRRVGELLDQRRAKLTYVTQGFVLVTGSPIVRGLLSAVFWLARPGYPWTIVGETEEAFAWVRALSPQRDITGAVAEYIKRRDTLVAARAPAGAA